MHLLTIDMTLGCKGLCICTNCSRDLVKFLFLLLLCGVRFMMPPTWLSHWSPNWCTGCSLSQDTKVEDAAQIVRALAVNRHCGNKVRIIVEVLEPGTQTCAVWDETESGAIEVICPAKIHYKMLSRRLLSLYPLPCPLICNLFVLSWLCFFFANKQPCCKGPMHKLVIKSCG